jgi:hypothetical protein
MRRIVSLIVYLALALAAAYVIVHLWAPHYDPLRR